MDKKIKKIIEELTKNPNLKEISISREIFDKLEKMINIGYKFPNSDVFETDYGHLKIKIF